MVSAPDLSCVLLVADQVRQALREIQDLSALTVEMSGDLCYSPAAKAIERLLADPATRPWVYMALAEYLTSALDGCPLDVEKWEPLQRLRRPAKVHSFNP